jgi:NTE family protein
MNGAGLLGFLGTRDHLVPASGLRKLIERNVQHELLEEMPIPLHVVAVDVISGEELRLSRGPIVDAVLASAAIPGVVAPVRWQDRTLMDGGVANNTPISHAVELGAERIYVLPTGHACALEEAPRGALAVALHAISACTERCTRVPRRRPRGRVPDAGRAQLSRVWSARRWPR